ncbi:MAG: aldo/keto reductase [Verrucomicrobia bacterium]|nr:aldo/keto reductase [Verrucomicrobiota bacterium]MCH8526844.1 aldo/keto reductase [Kiritimatiellia bacterium]
MIYKQLGKTEWNSSAVGLGTWNIGNQWGELTDRESDAILRTAIESGMNLIDTAESYGIPNGCSELRIGRVLHEFDREKLFIVSKIGNWGKRTGPGVPKTTPDMIRLCGHAIAGRMKTTYIDTILCHEGDIEDPSVYIEGFKQLVWEGMLRTYGISTNNLEVLKRFQELSGGNCAVVELEYSLLDRSADEGLIDYCRQEDMGILVRGPLNKGILSGKYDLDTVFTDSVRKKWNQGGAQRAFYEDRLQALGRMQEVAGQKNLTETALRFILSHPAGMVLIPGATRPEQVLQNAAAGAATLPPELYERLKAC